jgi:formylglycine-generating enzyme required for sulfatase activity
MPLVQGQILNNRYRIAKMLGQSNFGATYRAWDVNNNAPCAIEEIFDTGGGRQSFERQAQRLLTLQHPHLARIFDAFSLPGQSMYLATDFVEGEDLQTLYDQTDGPLPAEQVVMWTARICDALSYLHSQQPPFIHGNLKPANIRVTPDGKPMLVGFGAMAVYDSQTQSIPIPHAISVGFSPPEQYGKGKVDARSDVYALGSTLYTLLGGKHLPESALIKGKDVPTPLTVNQLNPQISPQISAVIDRAINIDQEKRFASIAEFKQTLAQALPAGKFSGTSAPISTSISTPIPTPPPRAKKRTGARTALTVIVLLVLCLAVLAIGGWLAYPYIVDMLATSTPTRTATLSASPTLTFTVKPSNTPTSTLTPTPEESPTPTSLPGQWQDDFGVPMALVDAGEFIMGSLQGDMAERPPHPVTLAAYYIDVYEVTNARYKECVDAGTCQQPLDLSAKSHPSYYENLDFEDYPVLYVNWDMAQTYCQWRDGRLPTEAEWEKAARGTDERTFPWGEDQPNCSYANFWNNEPDCIANVAKVGGYEIGVSPYKIYDLAGNVWEWVQDWYDELYYASSSAENPQGPDTGQLRVLRGGSFSNGVMSIRTTTRGRNLPSKGYNYVGFRCVRLP